MFSAVSRDTLFPMLTYIGEKLLCLIITPTVSPFTLRYSFSFTLTMLPVRIFFATPTVGISSTTPKCEAIPSFLG